MTLKQVSSWLCTACLFVALYLVLMAFIGSKDLAVSFSDTGAFGAAILSLALGAWQPPQTGASK